MKPATVPGWAHARRKAYEVHLATASPAAKAILERIDALFEIEAELRGHPPQTRLAARQTRTVSLLDELAAAMDDTEARISDKSTLAQAIHDTRSRWEAFRRFT